MENKSMFLHYYCQKCKGDEVHEIRPTGLVKMRTKKGSPPDELMSFEYACLKCMGKQADLMDYNERHPSNQLEFDPLYWQIAYMQIPLWNEFLKFGV